MLYFDSAYEQKKAEAEAQEKEHQVSKAEMTRTAKAAI